MATGDIMNEDQFRELVAAAKNLADAGGEIAKVLALYVKDVKDPQAHARLTRTLHVVRDCSVSLDRALRDAPRAAS
jgi:hypothetical protein